MDTKKIIAVAFAAVAVGASAENIEPVDSIDFESFAENTVITNGVEKANVSQWMCNGDCVSNIVILSAHGRSGTAGTGRPDAFASADDTKALQVLSSEPLYRTINTYNEGASFADLTAYDLTSTTYFDMLVRFTPSEVPPTAVSTDKILIWVNSDTNLVVTAKRLYQYGDSIGAAVANFTNTTSVVDDQWHRVTVVAIPTIVTNLFGEGSSIIPAFKVYIDGALQTFSDSAFGAGVTNILEDKGEYGYQGELVAGMEEAIQQNALIPSLEVAESDGVVYTSVGTLAAAGFQGVGFVDEYVFTTVEPAFFTPAATTYAFTLIWSGANVSAVTYQIGEDAPISAVLAENSVTTNIAPNTTVIVNATAADWYKVSSGTGSVTVASDNFTNVIVTADVEKNDVAMNADFEGVADFSKVAAWAKANELSPSALNSSGKNSYDSYLLNMPIAEYEMKVVSIAKNQVDDSKWDVTVAVYATSSGEEQTIPDTVNGTICVKSAATLEGWASATPSEEGISVSTAAGRKVITITPESDEVNFFEVYVK